MRPAPQGAVSGRRQELQETGLEPPSKKVKASIPDFEELECGGQGACGFNSVARSRMWLPWVRPFSVRFTNISWNIGGGYEPFWCFHPHAMEEQENGPIPNSFQEWHAWLLRPGKYASGLALKAAAKRLRVKLVILEVGRGDLAYKVTAVLDQGRREICRLFSLFGIITTSWPVPAPGKTFPTDWVEAKEQVNLSSVSCLWHGAGSGELDSWCPPGTPPSVDADWSCHHALPGS